MPQQSIFDLDGRQEIEKQNCALVDETCELQDKLANLKDECAVLEKKVSELEQENDKLKDRWKEMQQDIDRLTRYDLSEGGCDESTCNAKMSPHSKGDYLPYDEVERICEI